MSSDSLEIDELTTTSPPCDSVLPILDSAKQVPDQEEMPLDHQAIAEFRDFLKKNRESLGTGLGAFHTDNHSNW